MLRVAIDDLASALTRRFTAAGVADRDVSGLVDYFVTVERAGSATHGLVRVANVLEHIAANGPGGQPIADAIAAGVVRIDAHGIHGLVAARHSLDRLVDLTREHGSGLVATTGYGGNTGALGYFTAEAARHGLVAFAMSTCEAGVAPTGGIDPVLGTNPIAFSFPAEPDPITLDMATSAISYGTIQRYRQRGERVPPGAVIAADGSPSTDPADADTGAQLPMAGHKGYGLGLLVELLAGPFIGAKAGRRAVIGDDGTVMVAVTVDRFRSGRDVATDVAALIDELHASRPIDPAQPVVVPGERSAARWRASGRTGSVDVDDALWRRLLDSGAEE